MNWPDKLNTIEAFAYAPSLTDCTEDELLAELQEQGVIGVTRLRSTNAEPHPGMKFRFQGKTHPRTIKVGFEDFKLRLWKPSPQLCRRCAAYGHSAKTCRASTLRCLRCSDSHATDCKNKTLHAAHTAMDPGA